jgi:predicted GNAT superfamily acetyltransferase
MEHASLRPGERFAVRTDATGLVIRPFASRDDYDACVALQETTWGVGFNERVPPGILRLSQRLGGIASGAFSETGELLGFVFGMTGLHRGRLTHWSDMLAVRPDARDRGIGETLKWHQRERLLATGVPLAQWTFDPLEARNAWLNFSRLGGVANEYARDFYDTSDSPLHQGLPTDRLIVSWLLDSDSVVQRRRNGVPDYADALRHAPLVNPVRDDAEAPTLEDLRLDLRAPILRIAIPPDIQTLKRDLPAVGLCWQLCVRAAFEHCFTKGYTVVGFLRDEDVRCYVLERGTG